MSARTAPTGRITARRGRNTLQSVEQPSISEQYTPFRTRVQTGDELQRPVQSFPRPLAPGAVEWAYRSTQVVAAYVATELGFDGILYASVQVGAAPADPDDDDYGPFGGDQDGLLIWPVDEDEIDQHNIVLFGAAGGVEQQGRAGRGRSGLRYIDGSVSVRRVMGLQVKTESAYVHMPPVVPSMGEVRPKAGDDLGFDFDF